MIRKIVPENGNYSGFLILSACLLLLLSFGYRSGFGLFVKPITEANGWGREVISVALAVQNLFWGIVAVFAAGDRIFRLRFSRCLYYSPHAGLFNRYRFRRRSRRVEHFHHRFMQFFWRLFIGNYIG